MAGSSDISAAELDVWRSFLAAQAHLTLEVDRQLQRDSGLTGAEYGTLAALTEAPGGRLRVGQIAELLAWERSRVSHLVTRMERRGLVRRHECADDGRASEFLVTPRGRRILRGARDGHAAQLRASFLDRIRPQELPVLQAVFDRITGS